MADPVTLGLGAVSLGGKLLGNYFDKQAADEANARMREAQQRAYEKQMQMLQDLEDFYGGRESLQAEYQNYLKQIKEFDPTVQMPDFTYGKDVKDFLDPSMQYQREVADTALQQSLAGRGGLYSGKAMRELQEKGMKFAQTDYNNAFDRMTTDRQFSYNDFTNRFKNLVANKEAEYSKLADLFKNSSGNRDKIATLMQSMGSAGSNLELAQGKLNAQDSINQGKLYGNFLDNITNPKTLGGFRQAFTGSSTTDAAERERKWKEALIASGYKPETNGIDTSAMDANIRNQNASLWDAGVTTGDLNIEF